MKVEAGVLCMVIGGTDGLNMGKTVRVSAYRGQHLQLGSIWRCTAEGCQLITEYGAVGIAADFAQSWLMPIPPIKVEEMESQEASA